MGAYSGDNTEYCWLPGAVEKILKSLLFSGQVVRYSLQWERAGREIVYWVYSTEKAAPIGCQPWSLVASAFFSSQSVSDLLRAFSSKNLIFPYIMCRHRKQY